MKKIVLLSVFVSLFFNGYAQFSMKKLLDNIDWQATESMFVYNQHEYIEPTKKEVWDNEGTESNFRFKNASIANYPIETSYIRVLQKNKKLYRINFIVLDDETDMSHYTIVKNELIKLFGTPNSDVYDNTPSPIQYKNTTEWVMNNYKVEAQLIIFKEDYAYTIRVEPLK